MNATEIAAKAVSKMNKKITDEIFLIIQNNRTLMHSYLRAVEKQGLDTVNQTIGRQVKNHYQLSNEETRQQNSSSTLIQSHQEFE